MIFGIYSFHVFMLEGVDFRQAYKKSAAIVKKHFVGTLGSLVMYNLGVLVIIGIFYVLISAVLIAGVKLLAMANMGSAVYLSVLRAIRSGTKLILVFIAIPVSYTVISRMYYKYNTQPVDFSVIYIRNRYYRLSRTIYFGVLILSVVLNAVYVVGSFNKNPFDKIAIFHETTITAHRGASTEAPENTLAAFKRAMDDMADYIELDVQLTADDEVVVMHDASAARTTGVDRKISEMTLEEVISVMERAEKEGKMTVRLHTGDPCIYGAIREQMDILDEKGIPYDSCPGVSAFCGAASALNLEYTLPDISQSVIITRMEGRTPVPEKESIQSFAAHNATMVIFLSTGMLEELSRRLVEGGYREDTPAAIVYKATWPDEKKFICTVGTLAQTAKENKITKTALMLVGDAVNAASYDRSKLYDPGFTTEFREATK